MIARRWRGWAARPEDADAYVAHFERAVRPSLERLEGYLGASLERVPASDGHVEIVVVTRWDSYESIRAFTGEQLGTAVVEPEARAVLADFDADVRHIELVEEALPDLERLDLPAQAAGHEPWFNRTLSRVNDAVVRLGVIDGDFHWHKHDHEDELFYVIEGELFVDLEGREVALAPRQGIMVPRGVMHRTRAPKRTVVLMIEGATVKPTGD